MVAISVIIPVFKAQAHLSLLITDLVRFFNTSNLTVEIILVDDNPDSNNTPFLQNLQLQFPNHLKFITLTKNYGQHNAIIAGFSKAQGQLFITMDDDGQHRPEDIAQLLNYQKEFNKDVVYGKYHQRKHSFLRNFASSIIKLISRIGIPDLHPDYSSFRVIKRAIALEMLQMNNSFTFLDGYISWITTNVGSVTVQHQERKEGTSNYTIGRLISHSITILFTFSSLPIRLVTYSSVLICFGSLGYAFYILLRKVLLNDFQIGFPSMAIMWSFGLGLTLFTLSIIGEYLFRVHLKTTRKPNFIIKKEEA
jgi:undecaprenyl-phosphate 4-deoxy-4-formamido-L-arabinose transferase